VRANKNSIKQIRQLKKPAAQVA
jgi:hypothetical protein